MKDLDPLSQKSHIGTEVQAKEKQEFKFVGDKRRRPGQKLYELDIHNQTIKEIKVNIREQVNIMTQKENNKYTAYVNPNNYLVWASNDKNAEKKLNKLIKRLKVLRAREGIKFLLKQFQNEWALHDINWKWMVDDSHELRGGWIKIYASVNNMRPIYLFADKYTNDSVNISDEFMEKSYYRINEIGVKNLWEYAIKIARESPFKELTNPDIMKYPITIEDAINKEQ